MRINPWGLILIILILSSAAIVILFWTWLILNAGLAGLVVGIILVTLLIWFLRWREDRQQKGRAA